MTPAVYMAGPVDYVEHRVPSEHVLSNWRHRLFGAIDAELLCPTCLNHESTDSYSVMATNRGALERADFMVAYFPGDAATFGTPIEIWEWCHTKQKTWFAMNRPADLSRAVVVHPAPLGVFVEYLADVYGLVVVRRFEDARSWLEHQLSTARSST